MATQTRVWKADSTPARNGCPRPDGGPGKGSPRLVEPDVILEGKIIETHLMCGKVLTGTLRRASRYLLVIRTLEGQEFAVYKHAVSYLREA